jgi:hypothetical protein
MSEVLVVLTATWLRAHTHHVLLTSRMHSTISDVVHALRGAGGCVVLRNSTLLLSGSRPGL